jgi:hypothetical protein
MLLENFRWSARSRALLVFVTIASLLAGGGGGSGVPETTLQSRVRARELRRRQRARWTVFRGLET